MTPLSDTNETGALDRVLFILLSALFFLLPLVYCPISNDFFKLPKFAFFQILSFYALTLCLLNAFFRKTYFSIFSRARSALILFLIYLCACFISLFFAQSMTVALKDFIPVVSAFSLFAVLSTRSALTLNRLAIPALYSALLAAVIGIVQHFGADITGLSAISGVSPSFMASTLGHRNYLAELLCIVIPFCFLLYYNNVIIKPPSMKLLVFTIPCLMFFALLLTNSRSGWLSFTLSTLFFCSS